MNKLRQCVIEHLTNGIAIKPFVSTRWLTDTCLIDKRFADFSLTGFENLLKKMDGKEILSIAGGAGIGTCWKLMPGDAKTEPCLTAPKGKKLVKVNDFDKSANLSTCFFALADGLVLEFSDGFILRMEYNSFYTCVNGEWLPLSGVDYHLTWIAKAAYRLEDAPWWENIPEGGVLCRFINHPGFGVVINVYKYTDTFCVTFEGDKPKGYAVHEIEPVTDQWLNDMKRGF